MDKAQTQSEMGPNGAALAAREIIERGPLVLFDGVCNLCSWSVRFLAERDLNRSLCYASVQSQAGQAVLRRFGFPLDDYESFLFVEDGCVYTKSQAFLRVIRYLRFPWPLMRAGLIVPRPIGDWLYDRVAKNRYNLFGRKPVCMVPSPEFASRFLNWP